MIQRVQSIYLLLAAVSAAIAGFTAAFLCGGAVLILSSVISLAAIFMYRNRRIQMRMATLNILLVIVSYGLFFLSELHHTMEHTFRLIILIVLPMVAIFFLALAIKGIRKDEKLVRSLDRIR